MGSFYGNIAHSNKTAIQFDKIYESRYQMDNEVASDGVFVGRYVLVEYDEPGISGYYWSSYNMWTTTPTPLRDQNGIPVESTRIPAKPNICYLDLFTNKCYILSGNSEVFQLITQFGDNTPYQFRYETDLRNYGRGYDSTVWLKTFQSNTNSYKYVLIAEMNTVVPNFHLVAEAPASAPVPPYFDANLNNLDYYLHMQGQMTFKVSTNRNRDTNSKSDENITYTQIAYQQGTTGTAPTYTATVLNNQPAAIYYNKAGFDPATRSYDTSTKENTINYSFEKSNRVYGSTPTTAGSTANDIMAWYIYLPTLGNAICTVWDSLYSTNRKRTLLTETARLNASATTGTLSYDTSNKTFLAATQTTEDNASAFGIFNSMREYLGQVIPISTATSPGNFAYGWNIIRYADSNNKRTYYYPQYDSSFTAATTVGGSLTAGTTYYWKDGDIYKVANTAGLSSETQLYTRSTGTTTSPRLVWVQAYEGSNNISSGRAALDDENISEMPHTLYGAIAYINKLLGTGLSEANSRDDRTVIGLMNRMTDLIDNIDKTLAPNKFVVTASNGQITTGKPKLVLSTQSTAVTSITGNTSASTMTIDNPINTGVTITTKNKWIQMLINSQTIQIAHILNGLNNANTEIKTTAGSHWSNNTATNSKITIPTFTFDEAGHIINTGTTDFYLPYGFKTVSLSSQSNAVTELTISTSNIVADTAIDTFTFATGNKWIRMATDADNDKITIAHALSTLTGITANSEIKASATGWGTATTNTDNIITIPTFTFDEAGHVIASNTVSFYLPHSWKTIATTKQSDAVTDSSGNNAAVNVVADTSADTLTLATSNKWITILGNVTDDKITFGHRTSGVTATSYGLAQNEDITTLDADNIFEVPYFTVDAAGHITSASTKTVTIPESFGKITIGSQSTATTDMTANTASIEADSIYDEFVLQSGNKWIKLAATANDDLIKIAHAVNTITTSTSNTTFNGETDTFTNDFELDLISYDAAGHITSKTHQGYKLPYGYKTISVFNASNTSTDTVIATAGNCIAGSTIDTLNILTGNQWLIYAANTSNNTITLGHKLIIASYVGSYGDASAQTPVYGGTFKVPYLTIDEAGHVTAISEHTVTIPLGSIANTDSGNVVTNVSFTNSSNTITINKSYIGDLALTNYTIATTVSDIAATDSINIAFGKIQLALNTLNSNLSDEATTRANADNDLNDDLSDEITARENGDAALSLIISGDPEDDESTGLIGRINALENANTIEEDRIGALEDIINDVEEEDPEDPNSTIIVPGLESRVDALEAIDIQSMISAAINDIFTNFEMSLKAPLLTIANTNGILSVTVNNASENDILTYQWQTRADSTSDWENIQDATENEYDTTVNEEYGDFRCVVERSRNSYNSTANAIITVLAPEPEPEPEPEPGGGD